MKNTAGNALGAPGLRKLMPRKYVIFMSEILCVFIGNLWKFMKKATERPLGGPKIRKMVLRGAETAPNGCSEIPRRVQRGKKGAQKTTKDATGTPI